MSEFEVTSCVRCPMMYDGMCDHPKLPPDSIDVYCREDGGDYAETPHNRCPLRSEPLTLRVPATGS